MSVAVIVQLMSFARRLLGGVHVTVCVPLFALAPMFVTPSISYVCPPIVALKTILQ